jgi:ribonuclease HI
MVAPSGRFLAGPLHSAASTDDRLHPLQLLLVGIYMPCDNPLLQDSVVDHVIGIRAAYPMAVMIISGDMNMDRSDPKVQRLCVETHAVKLELNGPDMVPPVTHMCDTESPNATHRELDMVFVSLPDTVAMHGTSHSVLEHAGLSDHVPLLTTITLEGFPYAAPPVAQPAVPAQPSIVFPIKVDDLRKFSRRVVATHGEDLDAFAAITHKNSEALVAMWHKLQDYGAMRRALACDPEYTWLQASHDTACNMLTTLAGKIADTAKQCLPTRVRGKANTKKYMSKSAKRKMGRHLEDCKYLNAIITIAKQSLLALRGTSDGGATPRPLASYQAWCTTFVTRITETHERCSKSRDRLISNPVDTVDDEESNRAPMARLPLLPDLPDNPPDSTAALAASVSGWLHPYVLVHKDSRTALWKLKCQEQRESYKRYRKYWRKTMATQPRKAYKHIFRRPTTNIRTEDDDDPLAYMPKDMSIVRDPTQNGAPTSDPQTVINTVHAFFHEQQAPANGIRHGEYGDDDKYRGYPFSLPDAVDQFTLEPHAPLDRAQLEVDMTEELIYGDLMRATLRRVSRNKAPGPDGIPNELLKAMDDTFLEGLHDFMMCVWFTTKHPWPTSNTVLLHKKGDPTLVSNYRPIGLANTMYKLWTSMLTELFSKHAEQHQMLSACQEGFRPHRNTTRQLEMVVNALEDARLHQQDIYMLFVDFTSAFNTTDHDKLLQIMYDLGFPVAAIENVKGIYLHATTCVATPYGPTQEIPIQRGTIQGDTLSPFLFLVFIEPLLRWLHAGGRGYKFGCLQEPLKSLHQCCSPAYADDLQCMTGTPKNLEIQADKITAFNEWAKMKANAIKCGVTGVRYKTDGSTNANPLGTNSVAALQRSLASVRIQGQPIPFHHPDKHPYPYLGVPLTPTLNYAHYYKALLSSLRDKTDKLSKSFASGTQALRAIRQCILPSVTYAFPILPFGLQEVTKLDSVVAKCAKRAFGVPLWVCNRMVHLSQRDGGLGVPSLNTHLHQLSVAALVKSLNDPGTLGLVTRALLEHQLAALQGLDPADVPAEARFLRLAKTAMLAGHMGVQLTKHGTVVANKASPLVTLLKSVTYDPNQLGIAETIPAKVYRVLMQLGISDLTELTCKHGQYMISTNDLAHRYGNRVKRAHKLALNTLTEILHAASHDGLTLPKQRSKPLPLPHRKIARPHLLVELSHTTSMQPQSKASACLLRYLQSRRQELQCDPAGCLAADTAGSMEQPMLPAKKRAKLRDRPTQWVEVDPEYGKPAWQRVLEEEDAPLQAVADGHDCDDDDNTQTLWHRAYHKLIASRAAAARFDKFCKQQTQQRRSMPRRTITLRLPAPLAVTIPQEDIDRAVHHALEVSRSCHGGHATVVPCTKRHKCALRTMHNFKLFARSSHVLGDHTDAALLDIMYGRQECIDNILAEKRVKKVPHYQVQWAPTIILAVHMAAYERRLYTPSHTSNMALVGLTSLQRRVYAGSLLPRLVQVTWQPKWEIVENMRGAQPDGFAEAEAHFLHNRDAANAARKRKRTRPARLDTHLTGPAKVGHGSAPPPPPVLPTPLRRHIRVGTAPVNPDEDIHPPGRYILVRSTDMTTCKVYSPDGGFVGCLPTTQVNILYQRYMQMNRLVNADTVPLVEPPNVFAKHVALMLQRYRPSKATSRSAPVWPVPAPLVHALRASVDDVTDGGLGSALTITELTCTPLTVVAAGNPAYTDFREDSLLGFATCKYSNPWLGMGVACPHHSHPELDKAMRWAIGSAQKAAAFGLASATYMFVPDWRRSGSAFHNWLAHPCVQHIVTLPPCAFRLPSGSLTHRETTPGDQLPEPKSPMLLLLVANDAGRRQYYNPQNLRTAITSAASTYGWPLPASSWKAARTGANTTAALKSVALFKLPTRLRKLHSSRWNMPARPVTTSHQASAPPPAQPSLLHPDYTDPSLVSLRWTPNDIIYTDGSCIHVGLPYTTHVRRYIGAAVHRPAGTRRPVHDKIDPRGLGTTNTINRAELAAILHALRAACADDADEVIATDSLCCLHWVNRALAKPQSLALSKHKPLIMQIVMELRRRAALGRATTLIKVAAHTGVSGNEQADALAKQAALDVSENLSRGGAGHQSTTGDGVVEPTAHADGRGLHICEVDNDPYRAMYWVALPHDATTDAKETQPSPHEQSADAAPGHPPNYVGNLTGALARAAYKSVGQATTKSSTYAGLVASELTTADKDTYTSVWAMLKTGKITHKELVTSLRARWGGLYTAKIAARMNRPYLVPTRAPGMCPLCGMRDGATHILGECPAHKHLHIERHNKVGRCIMKHIRRGQHGACPTFADVGKEHELQTDFDVTSKALPPELIPPAEEVDLQDHQPTRFDIVLLHTDPGAVGNMTTWRDIPARTGMTAVEIGFRTDYDKGRKLALKQEQHRHTCSRLRRHYDLAYQVWDIGYTGMIPARVRLYAKALGVPDPDRLLRDVQAIAIRYAYIIVQNRRHEERNRQRGHQPAPPQTGDPCHSQRSRASQTMHARTVEHTMLYRHRPIDQKRTRAPPR